MNERQRPPGKRFFGFRNPFKRGGELKADVPSPQERELLEARMSLENIQVAMKDPNILTLLDKDHLLGDAVRMIIQQDGEALYDSGILPMEVTEIKIGQSFSVTRSEGDISMVPKGSEKTWTLQEVDKFCAERARAIGQEWTPLFPPETPLKGE